ncbi:MAG: bifunctional folylpolyglutamate synthase/dihydrofolate synthase [Acidobacteria bacterium]|nr:MAG: bifunctional folylpolyglutamate synthase/dihydrofolate synthase [Acidobacteriota bacterium]
MPAIRVPSRARDGRHGRGAEPAARDAGQAPAPVVERAGAGRRRGGCRVTSSHRDPLIDWLYGLRGPSLKWDLDTAAAFREVLGYPDRGLAVVHVAGTNGKGSVAAMLHAIAIEAGLDAGLFSSPHLVRPEERIRVGRDEIDPATFRSLIGELREIAARALEERRLPRHPSFFEMMTAAAWLAFSRSRMRLGVFEAGLGGRLDATNVMTPMLAVITTISRDHVKTLGGSPAAIAKEKAGIVKPGVPVLLGFVSGEVREVVRRVARRRGAPLHEAAREIEIRPAGGQAWEIGTPEGVHRGIVPALPGEHQVRNAALAIRASEILRSRGLPLPAEAAARGVAAVRWPGRLERLGTGPSFLLDAAHNEEGAAALGTFLGRAAAPRPRRVLLFGLTEGRDAAAMFAPLEGLVDGVIVTRPPVKRAQPPWRVARSLSRRRVAVEAIPEVSHALVRARELAGPRGEVVVAGSLYLVGEVRALLTGESGPGQPRSERVPPIAASRRPVA